MKDISELLKVSVDTIESMEVAHNKQADVIKETIIINQDIAESIKNENEQFNSINAMAKSNANDTAEVATQANIINDMDDKMTKLLEQGKESSRFYACLFSY